MPILGKAALAMWWNVAPSIRIEFEHWHSHEHFVERLAIPGFQCASCWTGETDAETYFVMYELKTYETMTSLAYLDRLNHPTSWSAKMMPHHVGMVRSQCRVVESYGGVIARSMLTLRISPHQGGAEILRSRLRRLLRGVPKMPGLTGAHLLVTDTPVSEMTMEQKLRGSDSTADWIVLLAGYDTRALRELATQELAVSVLMDAGATSKQIIGLYNLSYTMTSRDLEEEVG